MTSKSTYEGQLRTSCIHLQSNQSILTDAPTDNNGKGESFSPTDLVATALASCMLTIMGLKANNLGVDLKGTKAETVKVMASRPRRIEKVQIKIKFPKNKWDDTIKTTLKHVAVNCPVAKSVHPDIIQKVEFVF